MKSDKIRVRNLDEEVLNYFININDKITYDSLDPSIVTDIKNGEGLEKYNDEELRNRIINLEKTRLSISQAEKDYYKKSITYTKSEIAKLIENNLTIDEAKETFIEKARGVITEDLLSDELINKVNVIYEINRPSGEGEGSSDAKLETLKLNVDRNTKDISNIYEALNTEVIHTTDKIGLDNLDSSLAESITNARNVNVDIEMEDLSEDIRNKLNNTISGSFDTLETNIGINKENIDKINNYLTLRHGEVLIGAMKDSNSDNAVNIQHSFILMDNVILINDPDKLDEVKIVAEENEIKYIINANNNILYQYIDNQWNQSEVYGAASEFMAGKFALEYGTNNLYFGFNPEEIDIVVDVSRLASKDELSSYIEKEYADLTYATNQDMANANVKLDDHTNIISDHTNKIGELESQSEYLTSTTGAINVQIESLINDKNLLQDKVVELENNIITLTSELNALKEQINNGQGGIN